MDTKQTIEKLKERCMSMTVALLKESENPSRSSLSSDEVRSQTSDIEFFMSLATLLQNTEKDTERLDWLETSRFDVDYWKEWRVSNPDTNAPCFVGTSVREALDSAIAAQQEAESV